MRELAPAVEDVAHCAFMWLEDRTIAYGREKYRRAGLQAVSANYAEVTNLSLREGRFLDRGRRRAPAPRAGDRPQRGRRRSSGRSAGAAPAARSRFAGRPFTVDRRAREAQGRLHGRERGRQRRPHALPHRPHRGAEGERLDAAGHPRAQRPAAGGARPGRGRAAPAARRARPTSRRTSTSRPPTASSSSSTASPPPSASSRSRSRASACSSAGSA